MIVMFVSLLAAQQQPAGQYARYSQSHKSFSIVRITSSSPSSSPPPAFPQIRTSAAAGSPGAARAKSAAAPLDP
jgi:hypothetical protein